MTHVTKLSIDEYVKISKMVDNSTFRGLSILYGMFFLFIVIVPLVKGEDMVIGLNLLPTLLLTIFLSFMLIRRRKGNLKRTFTEDNVFRTGIVYDITNRGIGYRSDRHSGMYLWNEIHKVITNGDAYILLLKNRAALVFMKHQFTDLTEVNRFSELIKSKLNPALFGKGRKPLDVIKVLGLICFVFLVFIGIIRYYASHV
ncbi:YcxB family protein [Gorillibacterium sp. sgz5001074]|uniref:YcxB family protein n=1 Tax=Gorillibacterium sp. sgz5001074 TaxID=3446695 RepID=UPI003F67A3E2